MPTYHFLTPPSLHHERFDKVVHALLNQKITGGVSKALARKLVMAGACYLAGSRCRIASKPVYSGVEVRVVYDAERAGRKRTLPIALRDDCIRYHENGILVADKPAGLPSVPTLDDARQNFVALLEQRLRVKLGVHHRLDAQTSGLMLFTTLPERNAFVARLFQEHLIKKEYFAVVSITGKSPPKEWEIKNQLIRAVKKKNRYISTDAAGLAGGEGSFAYSRFALVALDQNRALIRCIPVTGRTHQLRVHLSEHGLPIVGDRLYGGAPAPRLMLHAQRLSFREEDGTAVVVEAPLPPGFDF